MAPINFDEFPRVDFRKDYDQEELTRFYDTFMKVNFPIEDELDPQEVWEEVLDPELVDGDMEYMPVNLHVIVVYEPPKEGAEGPKKMIGGVVFEYYKMSNACLMSYFAVSEEYRKHGLGKWLVGIAWSVTQEAARKTTYTCEKKESYTKEEWVNRICRLPQGDRRTRLVGELCALCTDEEVDALNALLKEGEDVGASLCTLYAETNTEALLDAVMDPRVRHRILSKMGFEPLKFGYIQPPLSDEQNPCYDLLLLLLRGPPSTPPSRVPSMLLKLFILDFALSVFGSIPSFIDSPWYKQMATELASFNGFVEQAGCPPWPFSTPKPAELQWSVRRCHALEDVLLRARRDSEVKDVAWACVANVVSRAKGSDDLKSVVNELQKLDKDEVPSTVREFLECFENRINFTDLQCLQIGLLLQHFGILNAQTYKDLCRYYEPMRHVSHRTTSMLTVVCAKYSDAPRTLFYLKTLLGNANTSRVRWDKLLPSVYKAVGFDTPGGTELLVLFEKERSLPLWKAVIEVAGYSAQEKYFSKAVDKAQKLGYDTSSVDGVYHRLLMALSLPACNEGTVTGLLTELAALSKGGIDSTFPKVHKNIRAARVPKNVKKEWYNIVEGTAGQMEAASTGLCYAFKMGECNDPSCKKSHQLVNCRHGDACTIHKCPYVHPYEVASRWATDEVSTAEYKRKEEAPMREPSQRGFIPPPPPPEEPKAEDIVTKSTSRMLRELKRMRLRNPPTLSEAEKQRLSIIQKLVGKLQKLNERPKKPETPVSAPASLTATYQRVPLEAPSPSKDLLDACSGASQPQKLPPLPQFERERKAAETSRLLSLLRSKGKIENRPKNQSARGPGTSAVPTTDASWFDELSSIMR